MSYKIYYHKVFYIEPDSVTTVVMLIESLVF